MSHFGPPTPSQFVNHAQFQQVLQQVGQSMATVAYRVQTVRARAYAVEADAAVRAAGRTPRMPPRFRSQHGEDATVWELLDGQLDGLYVEVGAFDGSSYSVTYALDACGWDGLLVEAIPEQFERCKVNRPHARVEQAALMGPGAPESIEFTVVQDRFGGMLSYGAPDPAHVAAIRTLPNRKVTVRTAMLDDLLQKHFPGRRVDLAVIDVEGNEAELLRGFDLATWRPRIMLVEDNSRGADTRIDNYMNGKPYKLGGWVEVNRIYVHEDQTEIYNRMVRPA